MSVSHHGQTRYFLAAWAIGALALGSCKSEPEGERRWVACNCEYLTDFDHPGHVAVDVCTNDRDPASAAVICGQSTGVGAVSHCTCGAPAAICEKSDACRLTNSSGKR